MCPRVITSYLGFGKPVLQLFFIIHMRLRAGVGFPPLEFELFYLPLCCFVARVFPRAVCFTLEPETVYGRQCQSKYGGDIDVRFVRLKRFENVMPTYAYLASRAFLSL